MHFWLPSSFLALLLLFPPFAPSTRAQGPPPIVLDCFFCRHSNRERDVIDRLDQHPECLSFELFANHSQFRRTCTKMEPFCTTSVSSLNGFFADMRRDCAERCRPGCEESGYGIFVRKCTRCCQSSLCNNFDGRKFLLNEVDVRLLSPGATAMNKIRSLLNVEDNPLTENGNGNSGKEAMKLLILMLIFTIAINAKRIVF